MNNYGYMPWLKQHYLPEPETALAPETVEIPICHMLDSALIQIYGKMALGRIVHITLPW